MNDTTSENWEQKTIANLLMENVKENRRKRRWGIFFKFLFFFYFIIIFLLITATSDFTEKGFDKPHAAIVEISGAIMQGKTSNAEDINSALRKAFKEETAKAVIIKINSPGGTPVQADDIYNEMRRLKQKYPDKPLYAVCTDMCASAAYYIAAAADNVYANETSIVGSIGVLMDGFGFVDTMKKLGVERRLITAGTHKGFLDPFSPENKTEKKHIQKILEQVHQQFILKVKTGRGKRLKEDPTLFSGMLWNGIEAKALGLVDGFASTEVVVRDIVKTKRMVNYTVEPSVFDRISKRIGTSFAGELISYLGADNSAAIKAVV